jgi:hypothetical protein
MKKIIFNVLSAIFIWLGSFCIATGQDPGPPVASSDQITLQDQEVIQGSSTTGVFDQVPVNSQEAMTVQLQFPISAAGMQVVIQVLDGGALGINGNSVTIGEDGTLSFPFQVSDVPGLYRVVIVNGDQDQSLALVQFWVPNPPG